ncbi:MAG: hypothetical protein QOD99_966 [Chthoniobacter sp.]|jgi:TolA-binding protein|nr:hypothetical protein [Chthoniobacter sp.]
MRTFAQTPAPASPADTASVQALELFNAGKNKEAAAVYEDLIKKYPTAGSVFDAQFKLSYLRYLEGDYDRSIEGLKKILGPPALPEIQELASNLLPQVLAAKASKMAPGDPKRKAAFEEAIKQFDSFGQKFANSDDVESANYGHALAAYQIENYDEAIKTLRANLQRFGKSETILDSQYLLALTLATRANVALRAPTASAEARTQGGAEFDEALKLLGDIVQRKSDVVLANDAQFQIGEVLFNRAAFVEESKRPALFESAMSAYRAVEPKEIMIKAQEQRAVAIVQRIRAATMAKNLNEVKRLQRLQERETSKLPVVQGTADNTISARLKIASCFYLQLKYDAARVMFHHLAQFAQDEDQKKQISYFTTMSYAAEAAQTGAEAPPLTPETRVQLAKSAVAGYDEFQQKYKADPIADNMPLAIGGVFLNADPKINDPEKAIRYFKESVQLYPKGRFVNESLTQQANALLQLKRYDEALNTFKQFLATNPSKELAAAAEFGIASIKKDTNKTDEAVADFKTIREKYSGTPQAGQAAFWVGQILVTKGDAKGAVPEFKRYLSTFPDGEMAPAAMFGLAQAQALTGDKAGAMQTYQDLKTKFPKSEAVPFAYFARATLLAADQKADEMVKEMRDFIEAYPDSDKIYFAYDSIGQNLTNAQKPMEAIGTYVEMSEKHPQNPQAPAALYQAAELWRKYAEAQGRYIALNEEQRAQWNKGIEGSVETAEKLLQQFPESSQVALALQTLLQDQRLLAQAKLKTPEEVEKYFQTLAEKAAGKPATRSKILFTLASFIYERDKVKALAQMQSAYDPKLVYAPADIDLYGTALLENGKTAEALAVYEKLGKDFPNPAGIPPEKAPLQIAEAQAMSFYGVGKALQKQGDVAEAAKRFDQLKKLYPWSPKILEANFGIAQGMVKEKKLDEAMVLLVQIIRAPAATAELRANSMLLGGQIQEQKNAVEAAIDYYLKIATFYESVAPASAEGLWRGGQLLEAQASILPISAAEKNKPTKPGQLAKAVKAYKDLADKYPNSEFAPKARERLAQLAPGK